MLLITREYKKLSSYRIFGSTVFIPYVIVSVSVEENEVFSHIELKKIHEKP